jgi:hypothetical protein
MNGSRIFILMYDSYPECAYADESLARYDCVLCNEAQEHLNEPAHYWVKPVSFIHEVVAHDSQF